MGIYLGSGQVSRIYLGTDQVKKVYLGTNHVYQTTGADVLFDNGWAGGIAWSGNLLPRPQYTSVATYSFGNVESDGFMRLTVNSSSGYSNVNHNCHVCTSELITVPSGATKLCVSMKLSSTASPLSYCKFGLLTADCINAMDATNGGQLSELINPDSTLTTYELNLNSGIAGGQYYAVINLRRTAQAASARNLDIYKVYFE